MFSSIFIVFNISLMGQDKLFGNIQKDILDCLSYVGQDTLPTLNDCESRFLNLLYQKAKGTFDFRGSKVAFLKGNIGTVKSTKKEFFDVQIKNIHKVGFVLNSGTGQLIIFNEDEVKKTGYDAVVISLSKKYLTNKEAVKRLTRQ